MILSSSSHSSCPLIPFMSRHWSRRNNRSHMATSTVTRRPRQRWHLDQLSTELIVLILTHLRDVDSGSLGSVRLVSIRFNAIVMPMKYHTLRMNRRIIDPQAEIYFSEGLANISAHTKHVKVDSDLNAEHVKKLLIKIEKLSSISWRYVQNGLCKGDFWVPSDILPPRHVQSCKVKLYIEDLPLQDFRFEQHNPYLRAIPTSILVSLKMAMPAPPLTARVESLKGLLLSSPRLETFRYSDRGQGTQFEFIGNERLPPFKELSLRSYDWSHTPNTVRRHWDFSEIRHLEMVDVPLHPFLDSVSFEDFENLETLHLDDFSMHLPDRRQATTQSQYILIRQIRALTDLRITCHTRSFPIDGLLKHGQSLQNLRFRDYTGFADECRLCPTIQVEDLYVMSRKLTNLRSLELDMDDRCCEPRRFLDTLCNFRQLDTLTLHTQTMIDPLKDTDSSIDLDHQRAMQMFSLLVQGKKTTPWRSITVNIGGWKPVIVRRLCAAWRKQHVRGLYAERCFVMERQQGDVLTLREELPIWA